MTSPNGRIARAIGIVRQNGWRTLILRIGARFFSARHRRYKRDKAAQDRLFDNVHGLDTGGVQHAYSFAAEGTNIGAATAHIASPPQDFAAAIAAVDLPLADLDFIDLGSGKGRALLLAADYPFRHIIGVEFATALHRIAEANFARLGLPIGSDQRFELVNGDATRFSLPHEPSLLFLYHPFDPPVLTDVARHAFASWRNAPRPMRVVYLNPVHLGEWIGAGWILLSRERRFAILGPAGEEA